MPTITAALVAWLLAMPMVWATGQAQATFRSSVDTVLVDLTIVSNADGRPIEGLTADDVRLTVDGKPRAIASLDFFRMAPDVNGVRMEAERAPRLPAPFAGNVGSEVGRIFVLMSIARPYAEAFISALEPADRVAVLSGTRLMTDLTTDRDRIHQAISGQFTNDEGVRPTVCQFERELGDVLRSLARTSGPKTVVTTAGVDVSCVQEVLEIGKAAAEARAIFYVIQPLTYLTDASVHAMPADGGTGYAGYDAHLGDLAGLTGGEFIRPSGTWYSILARVRRGSSAYYELAFAAQASERDGKEHKIAVTFAHPHDGATIRARPQFVIPKPGDKRAIPPATAAALLNDADTHREVQLRLGAYASRAPEAGQLRILVACEAPMEATSLSGVSIGVFDWKGRNVAQWEASRAELQTSPVVSGALLPPGAYRVRAAARTADGRLGAVDYEFNASTTNAGPYDAGALMLGVLVNGSFQARLTFRDQTEAVGRLELFGPDDPARPADVRLEIARSPGDAAMTSGAATIGDTGRGYRLATSRLRIADLDPGDYVVSAIVNVGGVEVARVTRTLRKERD